MTYSSYIATLIKLTLVSISPFPDANIISGYSSGRSSVIKGRFI